MSGVTLARDDYYPCYHIFDTDEYDSDRPIVSACGKLENDFHRTGDGLFGYGYGTIVPDEICEQCRPLLLVLELGE